MPRIGTSILDILEEGHSSPSSPQKRRSTPQSARENPASEPLGPQIFQLVIFPHLVTALHDHEHQVLAQVVDDAVCVCVCVAMHWIDSASVMRGSNADMLSVLGWLRLLVPVARKVRSSQRKALLPCKVSVRDILRQFRQHFHTELQALENERFKMVRTLLLLLSSISTLELLQSVGLCVCATVH